MNLLWAKRSTRCTHCGDTIPVGSKRLDDVIRKNGKLFRQHYHIEEPPCVTNILTKWFEDNPFSVSARVYPGRSLLDLDPDQRHTRQRVLSRLSALQRYYMDKLNLQAPIAELTPLELRRFHNFHKRRQGILDMLRELGGIPPRYEGAASPTAAELGRTGLSV